MHVLLASGPSTSVLLHVNRNVVSVTIVAIKLMSIVSYFIVYLFILFNWLLLYRG